MWQIKYNTNTNKKSRLYTIFPDLISIFQAFSRSEKLLGKLQDFIKNTRLCQTLNMNYQFFKLWCIHFFWWECQMQVNFPGVDFLGTVLRKKNCCSLLMSSITHETRHFHSHGVTYQNIVLIKTCFFFLRSHCCCRHCL